MAVWYRVIALILCLNSSCRDLSGLSLEGTLAPELWKLCNLQSL